MADTVRLHSEGLCDSAGGFHIGPGLGRRAPAPAYFLVDIGWLAIACCRNKAMRAFKDLGGESAEFSIFGIFRKNGHADARIIEIEEGAGARPAVDDERAVVEIGVAAAQRQRHMKFSRAIGRHGFVYFVEYEPKAFQMGWAGIVQKLGHRAKAEKFGPGFAEVLTMQNRFLQLADAG